MYAYSQFVNVFKTVSKCRIIFLHTFIMSNSGVWTTPGRDYFKNLYKNKLILALDFTPLPLSSQTFKTKFFLKNMASLLLL